MSDDLNKKIKQIAEALNQEDMPENLKGLISLFANSMESSEKSSPEEKQTDDTHKIRSEKSELEENIDMIRKIKKVMDKINSSSDPRVSLLTALKPFMGSKRQAKISNCINLLRISSLSRLIDDQEIGIF
jgi:hypothetical protein